MASYSVIVMPFILDDIKMLLAPYYRVQDLISPHSIFAVLWIILTG